MQTIVINKSCKPAIRRLYWSLPIAAFASVTVIQLLPPIHCLTWLYQALERHLRRCLVVIPYTLRGTPFFPFKTQTRNCGMARWFLGSTCLVSACQLHVSVQLWNVFMFLGTKLGKRGIVCSTSSVYPRVSEKHLDYRPGTSNNSDCFPCSSVQEPRGKFVDLVTVRQCHHGFCDIYFPKIGIFFTHYYTSINCAVTVCKLHQTNAQLSHCARSVRMWYLR